MAQNLHTVFHSSLFDKLSFEIINPDLRISWMSYVQNKSVLAPKNVQVEDWKRTALIRLSQLAHEGKSSEHN